MRVRGCCVYLHRADAGDIVTFIHYESFASVGVCLAVCCSVINLKPFFKLNLFIIKTMIILRSVESRPVFSKQSFDVHEIAYSGQAATCTNSLNSKISQRF